MSKKTIGPIHEIPNDLQGILDSRSDILEKWDDLTPLSQNEWICWVTNVKKLETRLNHLKRLQGELLEGKRRPCCWPGCPHRRPNAQKWFEKNPKQ